ncbi:MAG: hypothetical protein ABI579_04115 [Candidatus Sumerlaeota bacterium]
MNRFVIFAVLLVFSFSHFSAHAWIDGGESQVVDFVTGVTKNSGEETTTTASLAYTLGMGAEQSVDGVVMGKSIRFSENHVLCQPLRIGMKRSDFKQYRFRGTLEFEDTMHNDVKVFARYTYNQQLWSDWIPVVPELKMGSPVQPLKFECQLAISSSQRILSRDTYWREWAYPPGLAKYTGANYEEYCEYLRDNHPEVLETEIPTIRFVQLRIECGDGSTPRATLKKLSWGGSWMISGLRQ